MQPGIQRCLRKAQNIWLFFFQCAKNCFVLNKGKRYIRLKIPSHHSQKADGGGTSQLPCPAPFSRGQTSHLRVLTRSGGGSSLCTALQGRLTSPDSRGEAKRAFRACNPLTTSRQPKHGHLLHYWVRGSGEEATATTHPTSGPMWGGSVSLRSCTQHSLCNPLLWLPFYFRGKKTWRHCGGLPLTFSCGTASGLQTAEPGARNSWLICSAARSVDLRLALSLGSVQHKEWSATFFSSTKTGKRL